MSQFLTKLENKQRYLPFFSCNFRRVLDVTQKVFRDFLCNLLVKGLLLENLCKDKCLVFDKRSKGEI